MATEEDPYQPRTTKDHSFDELAREMANGSISRGRAMKLMGAALLGGVLSSIPGIAYATHKPGHGGGPCEVGSFQCGRRCCPQEARCVRGECICPTVDETSTLIPCNARAPASSQFDLCRCPSGYTCQTPGPGIVTGVCCPSGQTCFEVPEAT